MAGRLAGLLAVFVLAGCGGMRPAPVGESRAPTPVEAARPGVSAPPVSPAPTVALEGSFYVVKKGDTLHAIALDHGVDYRELAAWNNLENINRITIGQRLQVSAPGAVAAVAATSGISETRPIAIGGPVVERPLDGAVPPAPTFTPRGETPKRAPKGGKLPYSPENLASLKAQTVAPDPLVTAPAAVPAVSVAPAARPETPVAPPSAVVSPTAAPAGDIDWAWPAAGKLLAGFSEGGAGQEANKGIDIAGRLGDPVLAAAPGKVVYVGSGLRGYGNLVIVRHNAQFLSAYAHNSRILVKEGQTVARGQKIAELGNSDADQPKLHFEVRQQGKPVDPLKFLPPR
ncbi:MAG: peptidoglycan DD-metalloendopeptidase family protein [Rhodocyclaceae bacterium]|nr:peptidoglycan DD-metalloendopeptidase family protein [Rhodocyclaceae bacterium]